MGRRRKRGGGALGWVALPMGVVLALTLFAGALDSLTIGRSAEDLRQLEEALRRGCVSCYAVEGRYPPDLEYLKDRYGIQVDEERYAVDYDVFAPNLMPDITVLERKP